MKAWRVTATTAVVVLVAGACGGSKTLSADSTCEAFLKADQADEVRYVRARLEANGALAANGIDNPMGSITYYCGSHPDQKIGTLETFFDKEYGNAGRP